MPGLPSNALKMTVAALAAWTLAVGQSFAGPRDIPARAISPESSCWEATINNHAGYQCQEPGATLLYFCTTPRTVCWPMLSGPYHRGVYPPRAPLSTSRATLAHP